MEDKTESTGQGQTQQYFGVGTSLDWESSSEKIILCVELPFWLLIAPSSFKLKVGGFETNVTVDNNGIEIQRGHQYTRTHLNTVFVGNSDASRNAVVPAGALPEGGLFRGTRTLLYIETFALADAIEAFVGPNGPRYQDGYRYFASLATGHLPVVNELINAYRRASVDPFATEVTAWDVPVWFVFHEGGTQSVCLYSHLVEDWYPTLRKGLDSEEVVPYEAATEDDVRLELSSEAVPGEIEMLDGWSLFHRGRYGDSIRSFVTAIEVLVEAELRRLMMNGGEPQSTIDSLLEETRSNFDSRLNAYCRLSRRRIPGPILHYVPYINGVRLAEELDRTRRLRHRIVHHGYRLDHRFTKPMLRAAETTSWLFNWLSEDGTFERRRTKNAAFFSGLRTDASMFESGIRDGKIIVFPLGHHRPPGLKESKPILITSFDRLVHADDILLRTIACSTAAGKDIEHFVKMCFFELGAGELLDSPYPVSEQAINERFRLELNGQLAIFFLLDMPGPLGIHHVEEINSTLQQIRGEGTEFRYVIAVVNDRMHRPWEERSHQVNEEVEQQSRSRNISIVRTADLARLVLATIKYNWCGETIIRDLLSGGLKQPMPPACEYFGDVYHFWERPRVVGVRPVGPRVVESGNLAAFLLRDRFHQHLIADPAIDNQGQVTFRIDLRRSEVPTGSKVFLLDPTSSFKPPAQDQTENETRGTFT
jgi:hypothetical protein